MPENNLNNAADLWANPLFWWAIGMSVLAHLATYLKRLEPFNLRVFVAEMITAAVFAIAIYLVGIIKGQDPYLVIVICILSGLGSARMTQHGLAVFRLLLKVK